MFDHVKFGVRNYAASKAFFLKALEPLGVAVVSEGAPTYGVELSPKGKASLCLYQTDQTPAPLHLAFTAENRRQVEAFHRAALEAGGKDNGAPGLRPHYHANYYAAFVIGPDGHNIEVVCHEPEGERRPATSAPSRIASSTSMLAVVQQQLDAYNAKDIEALLDTYASDAEHYTLHGERLAQGREQLRARFLARFAEPDLHARLLSRVVMGSIVVDHELITRNFPEGAGTVEMLCIYEVLDGRIRRATFAAGEKSLVSAS